MLKKFEHIASQARHHRVKGYSQNLIKIGSHGGNNGFNNLAFNTGPWWRPFELLKVQKSSCRKLSHFPNQGVPVWTFHEIETSGSDPSSSSSPTFPAFRWSKKRFGLDRVLERVAQENLLLRIDFERTRGKKTFL